MAKWIGGFLIGAGAAASVFGLAEGLMTIAGIGSIIVSFGLIITILSVLLSDLRTQSAGDGSNKPDQSELERKLEDYQ